MRSLLAISLVVTGCGDNLGGGEDTGDHDFGGGVDNSGAVIAKLIPEVCAAHAWPDIVANEKDVELRAIPTQQGAAILGVPRGGGALSGFVVDSRGLMMGNPTGTKVLDGAFTSLSATQHEGRLIAAVVEGVQSHVMMLNDDLSNAHVLETLGGATVLGEATMMTSRTSRVTIAGGASGVVATSFDANWEAAGTTTLGHAAPMSMTTTAYGPADAMVAWSSDSQCNLARVAAGTLDTQDFACRNARLAVDYATKTGQMVFEAGGAIRRSDIVVGAHNDIANDYPLAPTGTAPRIVFDGTFYWVAYLNTHGDLTIGYLEDDGSLASMAVEGVRPTASAYDLAVIGGEVWVYALDASGYNATQLCLTREGL